MKYTYRNFKNFLANYKFSLKNVDNNEAGIFFDGVCIDNLQGEKAWETESFINMSYASKNSLSKALSNLFHYEFTFKHKKVNSIESVLQGIKYQDKKTQNLVFSYFGLDAYHTRASNIFDFWGNNGKLFWQGKTINRKEKEYQDFLDELYFCAGKNLLFQRALLSSGNKYLLHHIGRTDINETVLTRYEYECRINALRDFVKLTTKK